MSRNVKMFIHGMIQGVSCCPLTKHHDLRGRL
jgi:hypothetical protein